MNDTDHVEEALALIGAHAEMRRGQIAVISSFGADSAALLHLVAQVDRDMPVIFLDTGRHFPETLRYRDYLSRQLGLRSLRTAAPDPTEVLMLDPDGLLAGSDPDTCCVLRKVTPLRSALTFFETWITGRRRSQSSTRIALELEEQLADGRLRINPLARWSDDDVQRHIDRIGLGRHPLVAEGYLSIGCAVCTTRVEAGEDTRGGRWRGRAKTECGIHRMSSPQS